MEFLWLKLYLILYLDSTSHLLPFCLGQLSVQEQKSILQVSFFKWDFFKETGLTWFVLCHWEPWFRERPLNTTAVWINTAGGVCGFFFKSLLKEKKKGSPCSMKWCWKQCYFYIIHSTVQEHSLPAYPVNYFEETNSMT